MCNLAKTDIDAFKQFWNYEMLSVIQNGCPQAGRRDGEFLTLNLHVVYFVIINIAKGKFELHAV